MSKCCIAVGIVAVVIPVVAVVIVVVPNSYTKDGIADIALSKLSALEKLAPLN